MNEFYDIFENLFIKIKGNNNQKEKIIEEKFYSPTKYKDLCELQNITEFSENLSINGFSINFPKNIKKNIENSNPKIYKINYINDEKLKISEKYADFSNHFEKNKFTKNFQNKYSKFFHRNSTNFSKNSENLCENSTKISFFHKNTLENDTQNRKLFRYQNIPDFLRKFVLDVFFIKFNIFFLGFIRKYMENNF